MGPRRYDSMNHPTYLTAWQSAIRRRAFLKNSVYGMEPINHDPTHAFMNTGSIIKGRPSMGSWLLYGLGAKTDDLPGFIVFTSAGASGQQPVSARQWSAGILPSKFQGIQFQSRGDAVHYIASPPGIDRNMQRMSVEEINRLNALLADDRLDPEIHTRITQFELAFRMQASVPELTDFRSEPAIVLEMYGIKSPGDGSFASNCLMARRLAERGVRMIQLYHRAWDHHGDIERAMPIAAREVDQACAALVRDLDQRGMLDDTLILWGRRVRPHASGAGQRPRSSHPRLLNLDGGRRHQGGGDVRGHRRARLPRRGQCSACARSPCDDPPPVRH